jgi:hypothetical protein
MTNPVKSIAGYKFIFQFGDGASPENFAPKCIINAEKGMQFSSEVIEDTIPDCDNPEKPGWKEVEIDGLGGVLNGAGMTNTTDVEWFFDWYKSGLAKNFRVKTDVTLANGGGYFYGAIKLSAFDLTSPRDKEKVTFTSTMNTHGEVSWADAAA